MKKKSFVIVLILTIPFNHLLSQQTISKYNIKVKYDSLIRILTQFKTKKDTISIINTHRALSEIYYNNKNLINAHKHARLAYQKLTPAIKKTEIGINTIQTYAYLLSSSNNSKYALKLLNESLELIKKKDHLKKFWTYNEIARIYIKKNKFQKAILTYIKSLKEASKTDDKIWLASANNNLGLFFNKLDNNLVALYYFNKSKSLLDTTKEAHHLFYENINENIANIYLNKNKDYNKALKLYQNTSKIRRKYGQLYKAIQSDISLLICKINLNQNINQDLNFINNYYRNVKTEQKLNDPNYNKLFKIKLFYFYKQKKHYLYYIHSNKYYEYLEDKYKYEHKLTQHAISEYDKIQENIYTKELNLKKKIIEDKELLLKQTKWFYITIVITLSISIILLIVFTNYIKSKNKQIIQKNIITNLELRNIELERKNLNNRLKRKRKDILNIVSYSVIKVKYLKLILERLQKASKENKIKKVLFPIILDLKSQINIEERFIALHSNPIHVNSNFETKLISKYPKLSKTEREICTFIKLNFSTKEIAQIRNTSIDSIKMARSRLRKKFNLKSKEELEKFIHSI